MFWEAQVFHTLCETSHLEHLSSAGRKIRTGGDLGIEAVRKTQTLRRSSYLGWSKCRLEVHCPLWQLNFNVPVLLQSCLMLTRAQTNLFMPSVSSQLPACTFTLLASHGLCACQKSLSCHFHEDPLMHVLPDVLVDRSNHWSGQSHAGYNCWWRWHSRVHMPVF